MKFEELKKSLVGGKVSKNYLITGRDVFLSDNAYRLVYESLKIDMPELNEIKYNDSEIDMESVCNALNTPAVFSDNKIVYLDLSSKYTKIKNLEILKNYLKTAEFFNTLIIRLGENKEGVKGLEVSSFVEIDCDGLDRGIAQKLVVAESKKKGKQISSDAVNMLLDYTNMDMSLCMSEMLKLANYVDREITTNDVQELVNKSLEYKIYELTEALSKKKVDKVYEILSDLKHKKNGYYGLIGLIYTHFRRLLHMSINKLSISELIQVGLCYS